MRRRSRIVTSAAAAGAVLAGAGVGLAAIPTSQQLTTPASRPVAGTQHPSDSFLAAVRTESVVAQSRVAELDRAIAATQAKIRAEAAMRAAQLATEPAPAMTPTQEYLTPTSHAPESPQPASSWAAAAPPEVHATTGASGGSEAPHGDDGSSGKSGGDDGSSGESGGDD